VAEWRPGERRGTGSALEQELAAGKVEACSFGADVAGLGALPRVADGDARLAVARGGRKAAAADAYQVQAVYLAVRGGHQGSVPFPAAYREAAPAWTPMTYGVGRRAAECCAAALEPAAASML
jgi:hypothetical protein